jgi:site-specific recombinase XerD
MTVSELRQAFLASVFRRGLSSSTQSDYRASLERVERCLEREELDLNRLGQRLAEPSLTLKPGDRQVASTWLRWLYQEGFLLRPSVAISRVHARREALTLDQVEALLQTPNLPVRGRAAQLRAAADRALLETFYGTGIRLGEAVSLDFTDLNLAEGVLRVRGKTRERLQPIGAHLGTVVLPDYLEGARAARARPTERALFVSDRGNRVSKSTIGQRVRLRGRQAGLEVQPHDLRRAFATHLIDAGAPLEAVRDLLGHQDLQVLHRYLTVFVEPVLSRFHPRWGPLR